MSIVTAAEIVVEPGFTAVDAWAHVDLDRILRGHGVDSARFVPSCDGYVWLRDLPDDNRLVLNATSIHAKTTNEDGFLSTLIVVEIEAASGNGQLIFGARRGLIGAGVKLSKGKK